MPFLNALVKLWETQQKRADELKKVQFGEAADTIWGYLGKNYNQLYEHMQSDKDHHPSFRPRINKTRQYVNVYLPFLLSTVSNRAAYPRRPELTDELEAMLVEIGGDQALEARAAVDARDKAKCYLMDWWMNYLPVEEYNLFREIRTCLPEALAKGRGVVWHHNQQGMHGMVPVTEYDTVDNLFVDPDHKRWKDLTYVIRRRERPCWWIADHFRIPVEKIRGKFQSQAQKAVQAANGGDSEKNDIATYYEVFSRMGVGHKLLGAAEELKEASDILDTIPYAWLAIMPGMDAPLNLQEDKLVGPDVDTLIRASLEWPIEFHQNNADPWPCTVLDFYPNADNPWATSSLEAALPLQIFLDHAYAYLMGKSMITSRQIVLLSKELGDAVKKTIKEGGDLEVAEFEGSVQDLQKAIHVLKFDDALDGLFQMISLVERAFERMIDMDPLLQGAEPQNQMRSAEEAALRGSHINNRPEEFRDITDDFLSRVACKESIATRLHVTARTVAPLFGEDGPEYEEGQAWIELTSQGLEEDPPPLVPPLSYLWSTQITTDDPVKAAGELSYKMEHGPGSRKNKAYMQQVGKNISQNVLPFALQLAVEQGYPQLYNSIMKILLGENVDMDELLLPEKDVQAMQQQQQQQAQQQAQEQQQAESQEAQAERDAKLQQQQMQTQGQLQQAAMSSDSQMEIEAMKAMLQQQAQAQQAKKGDSK